VKAGCAAIIGWSGKLESVSLMGCVLCIMAAGSAVVKQVSRKFFFEKKNQKNFCNLSGVFCKLALPKIKSFLLLFFKKEVLFYPRLRYLFDRRSAEVAFLAFRQAAVFHSNEKLI
jgi:hypothetical protein